MIGVDAGGTHTDAVIIDRRHSVHGKSPTTRGDYSDGIFAAIQVGAGSMGLSLADVLGDTTHFINSTTIVTNALTELRGSKVGVLITRGFRDTFRLARSPRREDLDDHAQVNVADIMPRSSIVEIAERIGPDGLPLKVIDRDQTAAAIRNLVEVEQVEAIAICFMWSFKNASHEEAAKQIALELYPGLYTIASHESHPVIREYERFLTTVMTAFVQSEVSDYVVRLDQALKRTGYRGQLFFLKGDGGLMTETEVLGHPLGLLGSGPAGGVIGASELARSLGLAESIAADMGGTSFDVSPVRSSRPTIVNRSHVGDFELGLHLVDVISIGAGGGSIAWIDKRGVPQVGPQSAGASPGPACYGDGGSQATVTDALVAMQVLDPSNYLGGMRQLDSAAAKWAINAHVSEPAGLSLDDGCRAIYEVVTANMAYAVREVSVNRGFDPRGHALIAYGGTLPAFAAMICNQIGIRRIVIPNHSSAFAALGLLHADYVRRYPRTVEWQLGHGDRAVRVNQVVEELIETARNDALNAGFKSESIDMRLTGDFRFVGQTFELTMEMPRLQITEADAAEFKREFPRLYESTYGKGTVWSSDSGILLLNVTLSVTARRERPSWVTANGHGRQKAPVDHASRSVLLPGVWEWRPTEIYMESAIESDQWVAGPAIVQSVDATIFVPDWATISRDPLGNLVIQLGRQDKPDEAVGSEAQTSVRAGDT